MEIKLREYQLEALQRSKELYNGGINRQLLVLATGLGKTITFAMLPEIYPELAARGTLVLVHREELVFQAADKLRMVNPSMTIGIEKAELKADLSSDVVVASVQTLGAVNGRRLRAMMAVIDFGLVIIDEAHHVTAGSQYDRVLNTMGLGSLIDGDDHVVKGKQRLLMGVTATPNRHDRIGLSDFFDEVILDYGIQAGVENGYLTDIKHFKIKSGADLKGIKSRMGDFNQGDLAEATNTPERNAIVVKSYAQKSHEKSAVAFCSSVQHAYDLRDSFRNAGYKAEAIDGMTPKDERREILRAHEAGEIHVVTNFGVLTEGYDGRVHTVIMARPTKSQPLYIQMIGRGVRTIPADLGNLETKRKRLNAIERSEKPSCVVLDFVDNRHDVVTAPSLFGLPPDFDSQGSDLIGVTIKRFNDAIKANPMNVDGIMAATSFDELEVQMEEINVWTISNGAKALRDIAEFRWMAVGQGSYQIQIEEKGQRMYVRLDEDYLGRYEMSVIHPPKLDERTGKWSPQTTLKPAVFPTLESGVQNVENTIKRKYPDTRSNVDPKSSWRYGNPTRSQMNMLYGYGIDLRQVQNKGQASDLISAAKAMKIKFDKERYGEAKKGPNIPGYDDLSGFGRSYRKEQAQRENNFVLPGGLQR